MTVYTVYLRLQIRLLNVLITATHFPGPAWEEMRSDDAVVRLLYNIDIYIMCILKLAVREIRNLSTTLHYDIISHPHSAFRSVSQSSNHTSLSI